MPLSPNNVNLNQLLLVK